MPWERAAFDISSDGFPEGAELSVALDRSIGAEKYFLSVSPGGIKIRAGGDSGIKLALQSLRQLAMQSDRRGIAFVEIEDFPTLPVRGFMLDISRCKVPKVSEIIRLINLLSLFKYNRLELYTEHTYAFEGREVVWAGSGALTKGDYERISAACRFAGVELVPNLNGLGHMERWLRHPEYAHLAESKAPFIDPLGGVRKWPTTLFPDENALNFMDSLYGQFLPNFSSGKVNIGGDEPWELGMGRSRDLCRKLKNGKYDIYLRHMKSLAALCRKRGKAEAYFWADVLMKRPEFAADLPPHMVPVLWGYYLDHPCREQCEFMRNLGRRFLVAPGTSTWNSFGSRWDCARKNIAEFTACAAEFGADGMLLTQWGDNGNHQPWCAMWPAIAQGAACSWSGAEPTEDELCRALDKFVFLDDTGEFSRALCMLGRIDPELKLHSVHRKLFFAEAKDIPSILEGNPGFKIDEVSAAADFALALEEASSPQCRDAEACRDEFRLAVRMTKWALERARGDFAVEGTSQRAELKFIEEEYKRVWLMRARIGGLGESAAAIRALCPQIFF